MTAKDLFTSQLGKADKTVVRHRRALHQIPEVAFEEVKEEIRAHLLNIQTRETAQILLGKQKLRRVANIMVFTENLE